MSLNNFYNKLKYVPKKNIEDKYLFLVMHNILKAKYLHASSVFNIKNTKLKEYMLDNEDALVFPISIDGKIVSLFIKSFKKEAFPLKVNATSIPYGIDYFNSNFKYGDPVIIVEGIADLGALKLLDPELSIVAALSNSMSKESCELLKQITNNFIIITDNDKAGDIGYSTMRKRLRGSKVRRIQNYSYLDDLGDIVDMVIEYNKTKDYFLKNELQIIKQYYINSIEGE